MSTKHNSNISNLSFNKKLIKILKEKSVQTNKDDIYKNCFRNPTKNLLKIVSYAKKTA
jgi:hypothetical protein